MRRAWDVASGKSVGGPARCRDSSLAKLLASFALAAAILGAKPIDAQTTGTLVVELYNYQTLKPVVGATVAARKRVGTGTTYAGQRVTDGAGRVTFVLDGLGTGTTYVLGANVFGTGGAQKDVSKPGTVRFYVGTLSVRLLAGGAALPKVSVTLKERSPDTTLRYVRQMTTDAAGKVMLDPPGLGSGQVYVLETASPWDGKTKTSNDIRDRGETVFDVGVAPLNVTLVDALTLQPLPGTRISVRERAPDGSLLWLLGRNTDAAGRVVLDLPGLAQAKKYVLQATVFNGLRSESSDIAAAGDFLFKVGTLQATVVSTTTGAAMSGLMVAAHEVLADGTKKWVSEALTDAKGIIRYDLADLGRGRRYQLRAKSPTDGSTKWSNVITDTGKVTFLVGGAPLNVTLKNGLTNEILANKTITARERLADGTTRWMMDRVTDAAGKAVFVLEGLGEGRKYHLVTTPYNTGAATSRDITAAGEFVFKVGMLEVAAVNPFDGSVLPNLSVSAREQLADGTTKWVTSGTTDAQGIIRFDLAGLGEGRKYVLEAKSPIDGSTKRSDAVTATGRYTFRVGNSPLVVTLVNALSGDRLANVSVTVKERTGPDSLVWVAARTTDANGRVLFDLPGLGTGRTYVLTTVPYNGGTSYSDDIRAAGPYEFRVGGVEVSVVRADGTALPNYKVNAYEKLADGKLTFVSSGTTDAAGMIRFDFRGFGTGKTYVLDAKSPLDGTTKRSQEIKQIGKYVFRVGNAPVVVTLRNALSGAVLPGMSLTVKERTATGTRWVRQLATDANGQALFDLDGLDSGRVYFFVCEPYGAGSVESANVTRPGPFDFLVGALEVLVLSGVDGQPLVDAEVTVYEVLPVEPGEEDKKDKNWKWRRYGHTDGAGIIRFDLPGLGGGRNYILEAHSPVDGSHKYSELLTAGGRVTFVVGNEPLDVTMINGSTGLPVAETEITVYELVAEDDWRWTTWGVTDAAGRVLFDLDGLGDGRVYVLTTDPYEAGGVQSGPISMPGEIVMRLGTIPVTVIDGDANAPMADVHIDVYRIVDEEEEEEDDKKKKGPELQWVKHADTDAGGMIQFDIEGVSQTTPDAPLDGGRYVLVAWEPFGVKKAYYSGIITGEGPIELRITRDGKYPLDARPPSLTVASPLDGANVDVTGFTLTGFAEDNATLTQVVVTVSDPVIGGSLGQATYDSLARRWSFAVPGSWISVGRTVSVSVRALDQANNQTTVNLSVRVIVDTAAPVVSITSHQDGDEVEKTGFLLAGAAIDDIAVASLVATVVDPVLGVTVNRQPVDVTPGGQWTFTVLNGQMTQGQRVSVGLEAADAKNNRGSAAIELLVVAVDFEGTHLINRITFGATPALYAEVASIGPDAFLAQQLAPAGMDDSAFAAMIAAQPAPTTTAELQRYALLHMIQSRRQLREVLTQFWDNHFNTDINKTRVVAYELAENNALRAGALGRFRDLLDVSARGPAMMIYLDNATSQRANPNENYARELMELHTLGVDGGYTQNDVEQVAKAFTGWGVQNNQFFFNAADHDTTAKLVLGQTLPAGRGIEDGVQVLDILARHPSTARFLCTKLSQLFVSDRPPAALVDRCAQAYLASDGNIGTTVATILRSPEFGDPLYFRAKIKTPLEFVVAVVRNFGATTDTGDLIGIMDDMGMRLFQNPVPTGWSETGDDWMNSNALIQRMRFVNDVAYAPANSTETRVQLRPFFSSAGFTTADGITGFLFQMLFHHDYTDLDRQVALDILTSAGTSAFDINAPSADARLRRLAGTVMSYPGYEFQ